MLAVGFAASHVVLYNEDLFIEFMHKRHSNVNAKYIGQIQKSARSSVIVK